MYIQSLVIAFLLLSSFEVQANENELEIKKSFNQGVCANLTYTPSSSFYKGMQGGKFKSYFSWDHVPVFWHAGSYAGMTNSELDYLAHHPFATITFEKFEGNNATVVGADAEKKIASATKSLKKMNPKARVLYYHNTAFNFPNYDFYCDVMAKQATVPDFIFKYGGGTYYGHSCEGDTSYSTVNITAFDYSKQSMMNLWNKYFASVKSKKLYAGLFLDRVNYGSSNFGSISGFNGTIWDKNHVSAALETSKQFPLSVLAEYGGKSGKKVMGQMFKAFVTGSNVDASITSLIANAKDKRVVQVNADNCGPDTSVYPAAGIFSPAVGTNQNKVRIITLAAYLIGACENTYYSCSVQYRSDVAGSNKFCWYDEYNKPLGAPLGAANIKLHTDSVNYYYRKFKTDTRVFVDGTGNNACICWSDNTSSCQGSFTCNDTPTLFETVFGNATALDTFTPDGCAGDK